MNKLILVGLAAVLVGCDRDGECDALVALENTAPKKTIALEIAKGGRYGAGFRLEGEEAYVTPGTNSARAGINWSVRLAQETALPVRVSAEGRVLATEGIGDVLIYVDVSYVGGGNLWGQKAHFSATKPGDWTKRSVLIVPERPIDRLSIYLMARDSSALKARFRKASVEATEIASGIALFDGVPVSAAEPLEKPAFLVRDVAANDGFRRIVRGVKDLSLSSKTESRGGATFFDVTLTDRRGTDRAVTLAFAKPIDCRGGFWFDSPRTKVPFDGAKGEFREIRQSVCGQGGFSRWPFIAVTDGGRGFALGVDPRLPGFFRVGASPKLGLAYLAYDFALVPEKRAAHVGFVAFPFEAKDGWRGALEAYQRLFPEYNAVHQKHQGIWMAFKPISKVEGWEDFGFAIKEGDGETGWDDEHDITTYRYTEPTTWWMRIDGKDGRKQATLAECVARAEELAAGKDPKNAGYAKSWKACAMKDENGDCYGRILNTPWCNGIVWNMNCAPGLGPDCEFQVKLGEPEFSKRYTGTFPQGLDGEYIDSSEMYVTAELDYNRANFAGMATPLVFHGETLRPGVFKGMMGYEYARGIHDQVRRIGRRAMANGTPHNWCWLAPFLDVMGTETNWHGSDWTPTPDRDLIYTRALCGAKPYCFLQNTNFDTFTYEMCEKFMQRSLAYGMYPGFFSPGATSASHYFSKPAYYNRDRPLFKKYIPLCRLVGEAGWRAVNRLTESDNGEVFTEQFGDDFATVFNLSAKPQRVNLRSLQGRSAEELVAGGSWTFANGLETVTIPPETVRVLRFRGNP